MIGNRPLVVLAVIKVRRKYVEFEEDLYHTSIVLFL
jgi:hypothetical protein